MSRPDPNGSQPPRKVSPAVYRRRRLFFFIAVILIIVLIVIVVRACSGGTPKRATSSPSAGPSLVSVSPSADVASESPSASSSAAPTLAQCAKDSLILTPAVSKATYGAKESPVFTLVLKNDGSTPCMVQLAPSDLRFVVSQGDDTIWRLQDCLSGGTKSIVALQVGQSQTATYTWQRIRSENGQCETSSDKRVTKSGDYEMTASIPGYTSQQVAKFTLQ